jgi:hypothetical protein
MACVQAQKFFPTNAHMPYRTMVKQFYDFFGNTSSRNGFYKRVTDNVPQTTSSEDVTWSFKAFEDSVQMCCSDWPVDLCPILISMDEIHVLFNLQVQDAGSIYDLYSCLKSVLSEVVSGDFCFLFLSMPTHPGTSAPMIHPVRGGCWLYWSCWLVVMGVLHWHMSLAVVYS